jgi:uncharacterized protein YndB with AHSA1/START domain
MAAARVTVTVEATIPAARDVVFRGFTDPEIFQQWFISDWGEEFTGEVRSGSAWQLKGLSVCRHANPTHRRPPTAHFSPSASASASAFIAVCLACN